MGWSLTFPNMSTYGHPLVLKVSYRSITSSVVLKGVQCERQRYFLLEGSKKTFSLEVLLMSQNDLSDCSIYIDFVPVFILLIYLYIFACMGPYNLLVVHNSSKYELSGAFGFGNSCARFLRSKIIQTKIAVAKIWIIINLEISF